MHQIISMSIRLSRNRSLYSNSDLEAYVIIPRIENYDRQAHTQGRNIILKAQNFIVLGVEISEKWIDVAKIYLGALLRSTLPQAPCLPSLLLALTNKPHEKPSLRTSTLTFRMEQ